MPSRAPCSPPGLATSGTDGRCRRYHRPVMGRPDRIVLLAFAVFVVFAGANAIGVRFVLREMGPFWAAAIRFAIAGLLLGGWAVATHRPRPRGDALVGTALFGVFGFGL